MIKCRGCGKELKFFSLDGGKDGYCSNCLNKIERQQTEYRLKQMQYEGDNPFKCPHCPGRFPNNNALERHIVLEHQKRGFWG